MTPDTPPLIPGLVSALGGEELAARLFAWVQAEIAVDELFVFRRRMRGEDRPRPVLSHGARPQVAERARAYCDGFFRLDPINPMIAGSEAASVCIDRDEIRHADYRETCFGRPGLREKLCLWRRDGDEATVASFYRTWRRPPFDGADREAARRCGPLLFALIEKHDALSRRLGAPRLQGEPLIAHLERQLAALPNRLPPRQVAVCARTVAGMTARGIALELGVEVSSVVTHRKRAYERLGVAGGAELVQLLF